VPDGMHWSRPGAERLLDVLRRMGGQAATLQLANAIGSLAVHTEIASLRCYAREVLGVEAEEPVECVYVGQSDAGRRIFKYVLCKELMFARRRQAALFETERVGGGHR